MLTTEARRVGRRLPELLRESPTFRRYWGAHTISLFGDQISMLALPLVAVLTLDANAAQMGYLTAAALAPNLLLALHAGAWVDRHGRRRHVMVAADIGRALLLASVPLAYALGGLTYIQLFVVAVATGALSVLFNVSDASLFVSVVPRDRFVEGSSLLSASRAFSYVAGPSTAGLLVRTLSAPVALVADALTFLGSAVLLGRIAPQEAPPDRERWRHPQRHSLRHGLADGASHASRHGDDQFLQLRLLCALRALRDTIARHRSGGARFGARRRRRRRASSGRLPLLRFRGRSA